MRGSTERILTTHVGSLPRSQAVTDVLFARERGEIADKRAAAAVITDAVAAVVRRQVDTGVDIVSDGETNKISYATYIADRFAGFGGDTPREPGQDLVEFPRFMAKLAASGATAKYRRPRCVGEISLKDAGPLNEDLGNFRRAVDAAEAGRGLHERRFAGRARPVPAERPLPDPGRLSRGARQRDAGGVRGIAGAGFLLQIDAPDFGMGRHTMYRNASADEYLNSRGAARRGAEPCAAQHPGRSHAHAHLLGQLRGPAPPRHPARAAAAGA